MSQEKNAFLLAAISDTQEIIRQIDTKTELAMTVLLLNVGINATQIATAEGLALVAPIVALILSVVSAMIAYRTIVPRSNPKEAIAKYDAKASDLFYISGLSNDSWGTLIDLKSAKAQLSIDHDTYLRQLSHLKEEDISTHLGRELLKVSFIRELKIAKMKGMLMFLIWSLLVTLLDQTLLKRLLLC